MILFRILMMFIATVWFSSSVMLGWGTPAMALGIDIHKTLGVAAQPAQLTPAQITDKLCTNREQKIDLNNANLVDFMDCPGFYPTLARSIVDQGPYARVEDVLKITDISDQQKQLLKTNLQSFTVSDPVVPVEMRMPPRPSMRANP